MVNAVGHQDISWMQKWEYHVSTISIKIHILYICSNIPGLLYFTRELQLEGFWMQTLLIQISPNNVSQRGESTLSDSISCQFASKVELQINAFNVEFDVKWFWHLIVHCVMRCLQFSEVLHKWLKYSYTEMRFCKRRVSHKNKIKHHQIVVIFIDIN